MSRRQAPPHRRALQRANKIAEEPEYEPYGNMPDDDEDQYYEAPQPTGPKSWARPARENPGGRPPMSTGRRAPASLSASESSFNPRQGRQNNSIPTKTPPAPRPPAGRIAPLPKRPVGAGRTPQVQPGSVRQPANLAKYQNKGYRAPPQESLRQSTPVERDDEDWDGEGAGDMPHSDFKFPPRGKFVPVVSKSAIRQTVREQQRANNEAEKGVFTLTFADDELTAKQKSIIQALAGCVASMDENLLGTIGHLIIQHKNNEKPVVVDRIDDDSDGEGRAEDGELFQEGEDDE